LYGTNHIVKYNFFYICFLLIILQYVDCDKMRVPYVYKESARWCEVAALLNNLFLAQTGRGLNPDQLRYLAKMALSEL